MATLTSGGLNSNLESLSNSYKILSSDFNEESNAYLIKNGNNNTNKTSKELNLSNEKSDFKIDIPRISSKDVRPQRSHSPLNELEQKSFIFNDFGARTEANKLVTKFKSNELEESIKKAKKFAMEQSVRFALVKQQQQQQKQQLELIKKQQALLLMCRIYVGSIFYEVKEEAVRTAFGSFGPIRSISMSWDAATNKHKGFAFIEFETPEAAQLALEQMNGSLLGGRNIKVGRPSNMPQAQPIIDQLTEEAKNYNRIYIASIHSELTEQDVKCVFEAFGSIKSSTLVRDIQTGKHKGYGFIDYETSQAAQDAVLSMNMFDLGGQLLRVGKAVTPPENLMLAPTAATLTQISGTNSLASASLASQMQDIDKALNSINAANSSNQTVSTQNLATNSQIQSSTPTNSTSNQSISSGSVSQVNSNKSQINLIQNLNSNAEKTLITATNKTITTDQISPLRAGPTQQPIQESVEITNKIELTENQKKILGMTSADDPTASLEQQLDITLKGKEQRLMLMQKLMRRKPESKILILRNMVGPDDVDEELENEITDECGKYGEVEKVVIYQEKQGEEQDAEIIVKIFVEFTNSKSLDKAVEGLNGRFFAGRVVKAEIYDQTAYETKDYSG